MSLPPDLRWPSGRRIAVIANIAFEAWSDGKAPGIGPMGNPLPPGAFDTNAVSWAEYGPKRGIQRLLDCVERHGARASVMVNAVLAERHPRAVADCAARGHEIVNHSYAMDVIPLLLDEAAERENIARTTRLLEEVAGTRPTGWISPRGTPSPHTPRLLAEAGYRWYGDCFDDDRPYVVRFGARDLVAIPLTMDVNDLPLAMRYGNPPSTFVEIFESTLRRMRERESGIFSLDVTAHAHVFGRPSGAWAYERAVEIAATSDDVWLTTRAEMADYLIGQLASSGASR